MVVISLTTPLTGITYQIWEYSYKGSCHSYVDAPKRHMPPFWLFWVSILEMYTHFLCLMCSFEWHFLSKDVHTRMLGFHVETLSVNRNLWHKRDTAVMFGLTARIPLLLYTLRSNGFDPRYHGSTNSRYVLENWIFYNTFLKLDFRL